MSRTQKRRGSKCESERAAKGRERGRGGRRGEERGGKQEAGKQEAKPARPCWLGARLGLVLSQGAGGCSLPA